MTSATRRILAYPYNEESRTRHSSSIAIVLYCAVRALARCPTLKKLVLRGVRLSRDEVNKLGIVLGNAPS
jgi:hypothetical protein